MAYVPGFQNDVFISYARREATWVNKLGNQLRERLGERLGCECVVWLDNHRLHAGQDWQHKISDAIRGSAAFIAVLSPSYISSTECEKELSQFLALQTDLKAAGYSRFLKVVKQPCYAQGHQAFFPHIQDLRFFEHDRQTGEAKTFKPGSVHFDSRLSTLSYHLEQLFYSMLRARNPVFVARVPDCSRAIREELIGRILDAGHPVTPPPRGNMPKGLDPAGFISEAQTSLHILGPEYDPDFQPQVEAAIAAGKRLIFWLLPPTGTADKHLRDLVKTVRDNEWQLPKGSWRLLTGKSIVTVSRDILDELITDNPPIEQSPTSRPNIYFVCDVTTPEDASFARELQDRIQKREAMDVVLPRAASDGRSAAEHHAKQLTTCDGVLMYWANAPQRWWQRTVVDLLTADNLRGDRALKSKALLVGNEQVAIPSLTVIQKRDPFDLDQLEPFLAPLRDTSNPENSVPTYAGY